MTHWIGLAYQEMLRGDGTKLRMQMQSYAACNGPDVAYRGLRAGRLWRDHRVRCGRGGGRDFPLPSPTFMGPMCMLLNVMASMDVLEATENVGIMGRPCFEEGCMAQET